MFRYVLRGIWFYRSIHIAVLLAVAVSTAVIAGALIVGDSVSSSLRTMSMARLGGITHVMHSPRFVTRRLVSDLGASGVVFDDGLLCAPAILMTGSAELSSESGGTRRTGSLVITGVDEGGWSLFDTRGVECPSDRGAVLGSRTAAELKCRIGDQVSIWVELPSSIPRDSLLGERDEVVREVVVTITGILADDAGASRFSLNPSQQLPYNAFLPLALLQERLGLDEVVADPRNPVSRPERLNAILIGRPVSELRRDAANGVPQSTDEQIMAQDRRLLDALTAELARQIRIDDVGLRLRKIEDRGYLSAESDSMILEDPIADAVAEASERLGMIAAPAQVYLANEIWSPDRADPDSRFSMYSIVAGLNADNAPPLGPFHLRDGTAAPRPGANEILLSDWLATDLGAEVGRTIAMRWHEIGSHGDLPEIEQRFVVKGILAPDDPASVDPDLTPFVDGVTNADSFGEWDQPFEMDLDRITDRDHEYWDLHQACPKAFVSLETAATLWSSRYGTATSVRIAPAGTPLSPEQLGELAARLEREIAGDMETARLGLLFQPVRMTGLQAAVGANNFAWLFLAFSAFLIMSAILLAALMFQLGIHQRSGQVGLLEALGFTRGATRRFFIIEGLLVAVAGSMCGAFGGVLFARLMIYGLTTWWVGAIGTRFLFLDVQPGRLITAAAISTVLSVVVIWQAVRRLTRHEPRELLAGPIQDGDQETGSWWIPRVWRQIGLEGTLIVSVLLPAASLLHLVPASEAFGGISWQVVTFFLAGFGWLASGLMISGRQLGRRRGDTITTSGRGGLLSLAVANASRNGRRSLLTTALIAFATFVIVAVAAGRRNPVSETPDRQSGNGGFSLVAQSAQPVLFSLNTEDGRKRLGFGTDASTTLPAEVMVFDFSLRPGQDASCLNLYQPTLPTLLGARPEFLKRGGFRFADTPGENPWSQLSSLDETIDGLPVVPVIGDMNTLQFSLKKGVGDIIRFPDEKNPTFALKVVGMLDGSIFQGVLVTSDENLKRLAPEVHGSRWFLIEVAEAGDIDTTATILETALRPYGVDTEPVNQRLAGFLAVQNTYLSTFQMLGGLGLLVGTIGLAAVMSRNVMERRGELALLLAVGFTRWRIICLVVLENTLLLFWGMMTGTCAALIAMLPHLMSTGADVPWLLLGITLGAVLVAGSLAVILPVRAAARTSIREALVRG